MHIAFRVDSSTIIGYGHVMRCLTLAHALVYELKTIPQKNVDDNLLISFLCRDHQGHINQLILDSDFNLLQLPPVEQKINQQCSDSWLGATFEQDAQQCITQVKQLPKIELFIVDHYAIDHKWHSLMKPYYQKLLVIDDLANRSLACDFLLDQTYNRSKAEYQALVPSQCQFLVGQDYILLRDEFSLLKDQALLRRKKRIDEYNNELTPTNILITMGGSDPDNLSQLALLAVGELIEALPKITVNLVISSQSIHVDSLTTFCNEHSWIYLIVNSQNMAELMLSADIAIGASGGTAWERCCLGLPCLTTVNAENQKVIANNLAQAGATINLGWYKNITIHTIVSALNSLLNDTSAYEKMSDCCFEVCDGKGAARVAAKLVEKTTKHLIVIPKEIIFHAAKADDCELIYGWQSNKNIRKYFINPKTPSWLEHMQWYNTCLLDPNRILYLLHNDQGSSVGLLRLDQLTKNKCNTDIPTYEISIIIAPDHQGKGLAVSTLTNLSQLKQNATYMATIHNKNIQSQKAFTKAGFKKVSPSSYQLNVINFRSDNIKKLGPNN
ncbi:UDP-2,4-diacetamido-2,4,6-trideoxy-beta-L-altropyranose hydrolase [Colwellia sp. MB3u-55]|uniref:UDP-2,4-diacetamido-2,4, 6-trideoxy-beta-L-altropyranose hydrolase n=1 Tax=Colwellia sp. MB3u-55 TaxID=2759810 RepID=UPI0015F540AF|nr:UDP-2,4-diacetamido-2,4,6-trideoxy-beta-L-altropyranose hydrolase [Colwellia sp. MB3u-55]MBA6253841.1 UDP-2,4-diacetamido-2,4,6-trideoxy-beta-L-altropyranose hydrolase [Colwellia sp. MB3u-55]